MEECKSLKTDLNFGGALRVMIYGGDVGCSATGGSRAAHHKLFVAHLKVRCTVKGTKHRQASLT